MTDRPKPGRRYLDEPEQSAYENGWRQEYDHDSFALLDRIEVAIDDVRDDAERCRLRAAWLEGAADALLELADRQHEGAAFARALEESPAA
jgi:hypothetical protein